MNDQQKKFADMWDAAGKMTGNFPSKEAEIDAMANLINAAQFDTEWCIAYMQSHGGLPK